MIALYLLLFYWAFAAAISVYRLWMAGKLNVFNEIVFLPLLLGFALTDVALNYTVLLVMGLPPKGCYTISARFEQYHRSDTGWRGTVATFVCERLLNPIDPSGNHC